MMGWENINMGAFLKHRNLRFKPKDPVIKGLKRIEKIDFSGKIFLSEKPSNTDMILVKNGDLVISGINVEKGAMAVYQGKDDITATIHYSSYEYDKGKIEIEFLKYFLRSSEFIQALKDQVPGGIKTEIKPKHLLPLKVCIPNNTYEQVTIVKKYKSQKAKINEFNDYQIRQLTLLKKLRQQILQDAVQGRLVPQDADDEPASVLLQKIKAEKQQLIKEGKIKKGKPLPEIKEEEIPFDIPSNWEWCRLGEIAFIASGSTPKSDAFVESGIPFLKMYNLKNQKVDFYYKPQFIKESVHNGQLKRSKAKTGDLLMNIVGPPLGKLAIIPESLPQCNFNQAIVLIRPFTIKQLNSWIYWYLNEMTEIKSISTKGVAGQDNISVTQSNFIKIPIPPLKEQHRIVAKVEQLMKLCDELEQSFQQNRKYTQELLQVALREVLETEE